MELALILPILVVGFAVLVQAATVLGVQLGLEHAAREGARAAAVEPERAVAAATTAASGDGANTVGVALDSRFVTVSVSREVALIPLFSGAAQRTLHADATMRREDLVGH